MIGYSETTTESPRQSIADIAETYGYEPEDTSAFVRSCGLSEWEYLDPSTWHLVYPKPSDEPNFMFVTRLHGGNGRSIFAIATAVLLYAVAPYLAPMLGPIFTPIALAAIGAGLSIVGNKLFPVGSGNDTLNDPGRSSLRGYSDVNSESNVIGRGRPLPRVCHRRITLPEVCQPRYLMVNGAQSVQRVFALSGRHDITDIEADRVSVDSIPAITTEVFDGTGSTYTFVDKIAAFTRVGVELKNFSLDNGTDVFADDPTDADPQEINFYTPYHPALEEIVIRLTLNTFMRSDGAATDVRIPFRLKAKRKSDDVVVYFPVIHVTGRSSDTVIVEIILRRDNNFRDPGPNIGLEFDFFAVEPPVTAYPLSDGETGNQWEASAQFVSGAGIRDTQGVTAETDQVRILIDEFDAFDWTIVRGWASDESSLNVATYQVGGNVVSFFRSWQVGAQWKVPIDQTAFAVKAAVAFASAVADRHPISRPGTSGLALQSTGQSIGAVTAFADGYVYDWDGSAWVTWTKSQNPAVWYYNILKEWLESCKVSTSLIDSASIVAWRTECATRGYQLSCNFADVSTEEALLQCLEAGFAKPAFSHGFGVDYFRDRSSERPAFVFSPRNCRNIQFVKVDPRLPKSVRCNFGDETNRYEQSQIRVGNPFPVTIGLEEEVDVLSMSNEQLIARRKVFDFAERHFRRRVWSVEAFIEHVGCAVGELVGIVTDIVDDSSTGVRIKRVIDDYTVEIDGDIPTEETESWFDTANFFTVENVFRVDDQSVLFTTTSSGTAMSYINSVEGRVLHLDRLTSLAGTEGAHAVVGPLRSYVRRCFVTAIEPDAENNATITLVDESPEIYRYMAERYQ